MLGVVLWSDVRDEKAVFWCEDHGDLAYFTASENSNNTGIVFRPGDMVEFDVVVEQKSRRALNACLVEQKVCNGLQDKLRLNAKPEDGAAAEHRPSGEVMAFHPAPIQGQPIRKASNG